jgi:hypothetical protein
VIRDRAKELICLITSVREPAAARAEEPASACHQRWEEKTGNDQLKTHLRGPGRILRSRLPELVHQDVWAYLPTHHALAAQISRVATAADIDPGHISFAEALNIVRRSSTGTAAFPPDRWVRIEKEIGAGLTAKRARHNQYPARNKPDLRVRHAAPPTVRMANKPRPGLEPAGHNPSTLDVAA